MAATIDIVAKFTDQATAGIQGLGKTLSGAVTQATAPIAQLTTAMEGLATRAIQPIAAVAPGLAGAIGGLATAMGPLGVAAIAAGAGFTALVAGMAETTKRFSEQADAIGELSTRTGVAVPTLSALRIAAEQSGTSIDAVGAAIGRMQQSLTTASGVTTQTKAALDAFGVTVEQLRAMTPEQQFQTLASAIAQMPDPAQRTATAMDIFGKSAGALLPLLLQIGQEGIGGLITQAQALNTVISTESAQAADQYQDALVELDAGLKGLQAVIAEAFLPAMRDIATEAVKVVKDLIEFEKQTGLLSGAVKAVGAVLRNTIPEIAAVVKAIATMIDLVGKGVEALRAFGEVIRGTLQPAIDAVRVALGAVSTAVETMLSGIRRAMEFMTGLADKARGLVQILTGGSLDDSLAAVAGAIEDMVRGTTSGAAGFDQMGQAAGSLIGQLDGVAAAADRAGQSIQTATRPAGAPMQYAPGQAPPGATPLPPLAAPTPGFTATIPEWVGTDPGRVWAYLTGQLRPPAGWQEPTAPRPTRGLQQPRETTNVNVKIDAGKMTNAITVEQERTAQRRSSLGA
jgi:phage-related protein